MTPNLSHSTAALPAERRQPMWPWLLMPLVALTIFFLLKTAKDALPPDTSVHHMEAPADPASSAEADSH
jgi:hypothetical protein